MNIQSIVITNLIGISLMIILGINSRFTLKEKSIEHTLLAAMYSIVAIACTGEMFSYMLDGQFFPGVIPLAKFLNTLLYLCNTVFCTLWVFFVDWKLYQDIDRLKKISKPILISSGIMILIVLGNVFGNYLFYFDAYNIYHRTSLCYILFVYPVLMILGTIVMTIRYQKQHHGLAFFPIVSFTVPFFIGVLAQALIYGVSLAWCSTAIGLVSLCLNLKNELITTDTLTGLYNRYFLRHVLNGNAWNSSSHRSGIMMDMDHFKQINDTYGHSMGDTALCDAADLINRSVPEDALVFRYAGDEFIVLLMTDNEEEIRSIMDNIHKESRRFNASGKRPYHLHMSMGYAVYDRQNVGQDAFFEKMDRFMYLNKTSRHESGDTSTLVIDQIPAD